MVCDSLHCGILLVLCSLAVACSEYRRPGTSPDRSGQEVLRELVVGGSTHVQVWGIDVGELPSSDHVVPEADPMRAALAKHPAYLLTVLEVDGRKHRVRMEGLQTPEGRLGIRVWITCIDPGNQSEVWRDLVSTGSNDLKVLQIGKDGSLRERFDDQWHTVFALIGDRGAVLLAEPRSEHLARATSEAGYRRFALEKLDGWEQGREVASILIVRPILPD